MNQRTLANEQLDNLSLQGEPLEHALKSLAWINRWFGNKRSAIRTILHLAAQQQKPVHIIDLGCGGGDLSFAMARALQEKKISFSITGIDGNAHTLAHARTICQGITAVRFEQSDILDPGFQLPACDILFCSHFIYHFAEEALIGFLHRNLVSVSTAFVINELERSNLALRLFRWFSFLMPISRMAKEDGRLAIRRSFTKKEWIDLFQKAGITQYSIRRVPLFRLQVLIFPDSFN